MSKVGRASRNASKIRIESLTSGTKTINANETGELYLLDLSSMLTINLPAPEEGQYFKFIYSDDSAVYTAISSSASTVLLKGMIAVRTTDTIGSTAGGADLQMNLVEANGSGHYRLQTGPVVAEGSYFECVSDGSHWYLSGMMSGSLPAFS